MRNIWGRIRQPVLMLPSGEDEYVPKEVDVKAMMARWMAACRPGIASPASVIVPGANHRCDEEEAQEVLIAAVDKFMRAVVAEGPGK